MQIQQGQVHQNNYYVYQATFIVLQPEPANSGRPIDDTFYRIFNDWYDSGLRTYSTSGISFDGLGSGEYTVEYWSNETNLQLN